MNKYFDLFVRSKTWAALKETKWEEPLWFKKLKILCDFLIHWAKVFSIALCVTVIVVIILGIITMFIITTYSYLISHFHLDENTAGTITATFYIFVFITWLITMLIRH